MYYTISNYWIRLSRGLQNYADKGGCYLYISMCNQMVTSEIIP